MHFFWDKKFVLLHRMIDDQIMRTVEVSSKDP